MQPVTVGNIRIGEGRLALIAGPCVIESESLVLETAEALKAIASRVGIPLIFKSSYDKANRTSVKSFRGPGLHQGLAILARVKARLGVPILSDIHTVEEAAVAAEVLDVLQIPAFLCRQTDLILAAGKTGKPVNVKKGQYLAPWDMRSVIEKLESVGNHQILLTERGTSFGYAALVSDPRSLPMMRSLGYPVIFDATHSVQLPGAATASHGGAASGGQRAFVPTLARAAVATGACDALFLEVHPDPDRALSDGPTMLPLHEVEPLLREVVRIHEALA